MADELISRQEVCEVLAHFAPENYTQLVEMLVVKLPAVDAVEVVRCCVCKWWNTEEVGMTGDTCRCERFSLVGYSENYTDPMDFCSYGKRREENAAD